MDKPRTTHPVISIIRDDSVSAETDAAIRHLLVSCFPKDAAHFSVERTWHSRPSWLVLATGGDGDIVGHIAVIERTVRAADAETVRVFGLQGVAVSRHFRGGDLTAKMMEIASTHACRNGCEAGLLFCRKPLAEKVYGPLCWSVHEGDILMMDEAGATVTRPMHDLAMTVGLTRAIPSGTLDLCGRDW